MRWTSTLACLGLSAFALTVALPASAQPELEAARRSLDALERQQQVETNRWNSEFRTLAGAPGARDGWQLELDATARGVAHQLSSAHQNLGAPSVVPAAKSGTTDPVAMAAYAEAAGKLRAREQQLRAHRAKSLAAGLRALIRLESMRMSLPTLGGFFRSVERHRLLARGQQSLLLVEEHLRGRLRDLWTLGERSSTEGFARAAWTAGAEVVVTLFVFILLARRKDELLRGLRHSIGRKIERPTLRLWVERWVRVLLAILPSLFWVLFIEAIAWSLSPLALGEVRLARTLLLIWAWYRVARTGLMALLTAWAASRDDILGPAIRLRILRSLRLAGRTVVAIGMVLFTLERLGGRGVLFHAALAVSILSTGIVLVLLLSRWRVEVLEAWTESFEGGRLARLTARAEGHPVLQTLAAFGVGFLLIFMMSLRFLRDLALRFGRVRRLFAAFERRTLERRGETQVSDDEALAKLPDALHDALCEGPISPSEALSNFPGLTETGRFFAQRADRGAGGSVALVGAPGSGRRTWLSALAEASKDIPTTDLVFERRPTSPEELCAQLIEGLKLECEPTPDAVVAALEARPLTRYVVRNTKLLALRCMGGLRPFETFLEIVGRSAERVQWVCVFPEGMWRFLTRVHDRRHLFQQVVTLGPWTEEQIDELIESRMRRAKITPRYQVSVVDHLDGTAFDAEVVHTARRYHRLVWDYADGNPTSALHFWLRSLSMDESGEVTVRLFQAPDAAALEGLDERSRFALASVALHDGITIADAARATGYPVGEAEALLENLRENGILEERDRHLKIATHWARVVGRFLRRNHLQAA